MKVEQRKVRGPEWGPQVRQTALLASPVYIGQAQVEKRRHTEEPNLSQGLLFSQRLQGRQALTPGGCVFLYFLNKTAITWSCNTGPPMASKFCCGETEPRKLRTPLTVWWERVERELRRESSLSIDSFEGAIASLTHNFSKKKQRMNERMTGRMNSGKVLT